MGGTAFLIWGKPADLNLEPTPIKPTFMDRVLGRQRFHKPQVTEGPFGSKMIDAPADRFRVLVGEFLDFLRRRISNPWASSKVVLDYFGYGTISVYFRGEQTPDRSDPSWYVQLSFSGCAGTAEISAELAAHWTGIWYREDRDRIVDRFLAPLGFMVDEARTDAETQSVFVPVGELGYGLYTGGSGLEPDPEWPGSRLFELDAGLTESLMKPEDLSALRGLDRHYGPLMTDGRCRCQLCMPEFTPPSLSELGVKR